MSQVLAHFQQTISSVLGSGNLNALLLVGLAIFGGTIGGRMFKRIRIPQVVGYIIIGIIVGKMGLGFLGPQVLDSFEPFNDFALGIIGFLVGGELKKSTLKAYGSQFTWILLFEALTAFAVTSIAIFAVAMLVYGSWSTALVFALLLGAISAATAAAGTTDVLWEHKTRGPLTTTILGIIALDDILSLFLFAIVASVGGIILGSASGASGPGIGRELLNLVYEIGGAVVVGGLAGLGLSRLLRSSSEHERTLTFSMGGILLVLGLSNALGVDTIMSAMVMGVVMTNVAPKRSQEVFHLIEGIAPPLYVLFFVFVGASLDISAMNAGLWAFAGVYLLARSSGKMLGAFLGALFGKSVTSVRKYLPYSLFSQSGVAIGLAIISSQRFPGEVGTGISLIITATTFVVQIIGPIALSQAMKASGEVGLNVSETDILSQAKVEDVMDSQVPVLNEAMSIDQVMSSISESDSQFFPVVDGENHLKGVLSIEGVKNAFIAQELTSMILTADLMDPVALSARVDEDASSIMEKMDRTQEDFVPVLDAEGKPLGIVEQRGVKRYVTRKIIELQGKAQALAGEIA